MLETILIDTLSNTGPVYYNGYIYESQKAELITKRWYWEDTIQNANKTRVPR